MTLGRGDFFDGSLEALARGSAEGLGGVNFDFLDLVDEGEPIDEPGRDLDVVFCGLDGDGFAAAAGVGDDL